MNGSLFKNLLPVTERIQRFASSKESDIRAMSAQLMKERPGLASTGLSLTDTARSYLDAVAAIPWMVELLRRLSEEDSGSPASRHAAVLALVFLVRCDDLIPDDTPGGYGYIDDYIVLRIALTAMISDPDLNEAILRVVSPDKKDYSRLKKTIREWQLQSAETVAFLMWCLPPEKHAAIQKLFKDVLGTYEKCLAWAAVSPESLDHRTRQLIEDPRLPGPVLTHPVDDASVWSQWEAKEAEERRSAIDEATSKFLRESNAEWSAWNREMDRIQASRPRGTLAFPLPGGGSVATNGRAVYVTPKPRR